MKTANKPYKIKSGTKKEQNPRKTKMAIGFQPKNIEIETEDRKKRMNDIKENVTAHTHTHMHNAKEREREKATNQK